ncbi:MAG: hypothetical protein ACI906_003456 [Candidatus Latescibacterota bacterium]|jgi:hypothetical protein
MEPISMSTERLRHLFKQVAESEERYRVCCARDIVGPGGGIYIAANSELNEQHLKWLDRRNPSPDGPTYVEVVLYKGAVQAKAAPKSLDLAEEKDSPNKRARAEVHSRAVVEGAQEVGKQAEAVFRTTGKMDFTAADLRSGEAQAGLRELENRFTIFHGVVKKAVSEYLNGNALVMELILKYHLDKRTVRHGLNVAAFATEIATQLALKERDSVQYSHYFGDMSDAQLLSQLGEDECDVLSPEELVSKRRALFEQELVEIFLGGFMHDCGLWNEPYFLREGHEVKGAKLIWEMREVQEYAPALVKIILFHSDVVRLADRCGVVKVIEDPDDAEHVTFKREFYSTIEEARTAIEMRPGNFMARVLSPADLRKVMPVALAERYITQTQNLKAKKRWEVIGELARYVKNGLYLRYVVALCNAQVEVVAPRRAWVRLDGSLAIAVEDRKVGKKAMRLDVDEFEAGSIHHGGDRYSPHLISMFWRGSDGGREKAEFVAAQDAALWDRTAGLTHRMYIPAGRLKNNLSLTVTGFMSEDVYERILKEYEVELGRRL